MIARLSGRTALALSALVLLTLVLVGWFVLLSPQRSKAAELDDQIAAAKTQLTLTRITDHALQQLRNAPSITDLDLYFAELVGDGGLSTIKGWKHLKRLNARGTKVTDMAVRYLASVPSLESVDIGFAQLTDVGLDPLTSLPRLKELSIGGNKLTDAGLQCLSTLALLTEV